MKNPWSASQQIKQSRALIPFGLLICAFVIIIFGLVIPKIEKIKQLQSIMYSKKEAYMQNQNIIGSYEISKGKYSDYMGGSGSEGQAKKDTKSCLLALEKMSKDSDVMLLSAKPEASKSEKIHTIRVDLSLESSLGGLLMFLRQVENSKQGFRVDRLTITAARSASQVQSSLVVNQSFLDE